MQYAVSIPNMAEPSELVALGVAAESSGWDGVFLWDHAYGSPAAPMPIADTWTVLAALAIVTKRVRIGAMVTPLARRRPHKVARESVTVDHLSGGRLVLGVGLGSPDEEFTAFGEDADPRTRAEKLDEALEVVVGLWSGEPFDHEGTHYTVRNAQFLPRPVNETIPVWASCTVAHRAPLRRAALLDGVVLAGVEPNGGISAVSPSNVQAVRNDVARMRGNLDHFDISVICPQLPSPDDLGEYTNIGVTWIVVTGWLQHLADVVATGPPR